MRAKEYIYIHFHELHHADIDKQIIEDLLPLRKSKEATVEYMNNRLSADIRYRQYLLQKDLYAQGNAMQITEPTYNDIEGELSKDIASEVREELFQTIRGDESFGYLYYILGTEQNLLHNSEPIDCIPNTNRILHHISQNRDDYPKHNLDDFINEDLNYEQYCKLQDGHFLQDDDKSYLDYFNRVYAIYDELRLLKQNITEVRKYLRGQQFVDDNEKYLTLAYIITLIDANQEEDKCLERCKLELQRIIAPLVSRVENLDSATSHQSPVYLNKKKGMKIDMIRVFNVLYELGCFTGANGEPLAKKDFMNAMGKAINVDLSNYDNDLSRALSDNTKLEKHLSIFNDMHQKMTDIFNLH
ncbi:MAG: hypothetical protein E7070_05055 [Bacteroidales bacterium]|nr:hypothetical protein [Bacteroidales bacterium]